MKKAIPGWSGYPGVPPCPRKQTSLCLPQTINPFKEGNMNMKALLIGIGTTIAAMYIYDRFIKDKI